MIPLTDLRVLLVEDNALDQRMLVHHLQSYADSDFQIHCVDNLAEALKALDERDFDCVLLDLSLPDSVGLASVDALLAHDDKAPVIVLTGLDDPTVAVEAVDRGAQDFLTKHSLNPELVGRAIRYAVTRHHSESQLRSAQELLNLMHDRERIARDLHDTVIQQLFATGMTLQALTARVEDQEVKQRLLDAATEIDGGIRQLRETIFGLHANQPEATVVDELNHLALGQQKTLGFLPTIRTDKNIDRLTGSTRHELVATASEALSNVSKHAKATAAQILVNIDGDHVVLRVTDNGRGFDAEPDTSSVQLLGGHGLRNMERRAAELSGSFSIRPGPGGGTELTWSVPLSNG